jgi:asparagine synthase (glutamine-hydrolysing)
VGEWFRGPLRDFLHDSLLSEGSLASGWFRPEELRRLVREHVDGAADHQLLLWNLLMLELWRREMLEASPVSTLR